jgi:hypothetical protein
MYVEHTPVDIKSNYHFCFHSRKADDKWYSLVSSGKFSSIRQNELTTSTCIHVPSQVFKEILKKYIPIRIKRVITYNSKKIWSIDCLIDCLLFNVPLENLSFIWPVKGCKI